MCFKHLSISLSSFLCCIAFSTPATAATCEGHIVGGEPTQRVLLTHLTNGASVSVWSNLAGNFAVSGLAPGAWKVEITTPGIVSENDQTIFLQTPESIASVALSVD